MIISIFLIHAAGYFDFRPINRMEAVLYDIRLNLTMPRTQDNRIIIIDIDEKSLAKVGRWPWSRDKIALLIDNLFGYYQAAVVGGLVGENTGGVISDSYSTGAVSGEKCTIKT